MVSKIIIIAIIFVLVLKIPPSVHAVNWWEVQSIDTMKYSRDASGEALDNPEFDELIEQQISQIAGTGATHVALGTPYDDQFIPVLERWVKSARKHGLNVWFRGNFSGWERWFNYDRIDREQHMALTKDFIMNNPDLFEDGDIFTACPECENGGPGDPRTTGDVEGFRQFMLDEYDVTRIAFSRIKKDVASNYNSMNGDIARLIMDKDTTAQMDGIVVVDHYVKTPEKLAQDVKEMARQSGGVVVLGEMGVPIPAIHGSMSQQQQAEWLDEVYELLVPMEEVVGVNYWVSVGGSTELWNSNGEPREAVDVVVSYYKPLLAAGTATNIDGRPISNATVSTRNISVTTDKEGSFVIPYLTSEETVVIQAENYDTYTITVDKLLETGTQELDQTRFSLREWLKDIFYKIFN